MAESGPPLNVNDQQEPASQNKMFIVKILSEMRSNFNRASNDSTPPEPQPEQDQGLTQTPTPALDQDQESRRSFTNNEDSSSIIFEAQPVTEECEDEGQSVSKEPEEGTAVTECNEVEATGDISVENEPPEAMAVEETAPESDPKTADKLEENGAMHEGPENGAMDKGPVPDKPDEVLQSDSSIVEDGKPDEPPCSTEQKPDDPEYTEDAPDSVAKETIPEHPSPTNVPIEEDVSNKQIGNKGNPSGSAEGNVEQMKRKPSVGQNSKNTLPKSLEESGEKRPRRSLRSAEKVEQDVAVKRSSRRMSKDYNSRESVLQNAIALKEKSLISFSMEDKPRRSSRLSDETKVPPAGSATRAPSAPAASRAKTARSAVPPEEDTSNSTGDEATSSQNSSRASKHGPAPEAPNDGTDMEDDASETSAKKARLARDSKISNPAQESSDDDRNGWRHASPFSALNSCPTDKGAPSLSAVSENNDDQNEVESNPEGFENNTITSPMGIVGIGSEAPDIPLDFQESNGLLCECDIMTSMYAKDPDNQMCRALDLFESRLVKCANKIDDRPLMRPCKSKPYQALCIIHFERMIRHHACPTCGAFCTQALVNICEKRHLFHKDCEMKLEDGLACPHCGSENFSLYKIQLQNHQYPLFLPATKPLSKLPVAKMSISRSKQTALDPVEKEMPEELVAPMSLTLSNGRAITSEGIPLPEREKLIYLLRNASPSEDLRYNYRALYQAAKAGEAEKVLHILGSGLSPNQPSMNPLMGAIKEGHLLVVHLLVQAGANLETLDKYQYTPLMLAVQFKHNDIVKYLIKAGADVGFKGAEGMTALHIAAKEGNLEACHYILTLVKLPPAFIDTVDDGKWTALVWGAENCHSKVVRYLLEKNADPQIRDAEMNIALHWSAFAGSMEITEDLLNFGCAVNLSNSHGDTPLHIAARQAADNCVLLLLARGARTELVNKAGQTPRDCVINKDSYCYTAIDLNITIKKTVASTSFFPKILCNDVSGGREENPIQCVNGVDDDGVPVDYTYITENCFTSNITIDRRISSLVCCKCEDACNGSNCMCTKISRGCWYDNTGKLLPEFNFEDPPMMFECNPACGCNILTCKNRVVQRGLKTRLQLCKTKEKSWGVITLKEIPRGTYVCEYVGEIISDLEADTRKDDSYLFDLDNSEGETYCLDARKYGNICRFINHSCRPNLSPVKIFYQHQDLHFPRIAMFASRDIAPNEELGFDYGEKFWMIKCKSFTCHCAEPTCRYSESTIQQTLDKYKKKMKELEEMSDDY
ncbi:Histone-lysine N-methyltransferase [Nesidiocoris tenuis]|uniref:Histone-lysine N-methyltransferase n=1 Tax=Nesidiocoris tenuis TaxID=355587 RepID=A0ABN7APW2_9HEMI|nr:Histone-lysine N-methyltransferase [Nesidiocoris tenuis]